MTEETKMQASCFLWFHDWGPWEQYEQVWRHRDGSRGVASIEKRQKRQCQACKKVQDEWITTL